MATQELTRPETEVPYSQPTADVAQAPQAPLAAPVYPTPARKGFNPWWLLLIIGLPVILLIGLVTAGAALLGWTTIAGNVKIVDAGPLVSESHKVQLGGATS